MLLIRVRFLFWPRFRRPVRPTLSSVSSWHFYMTVTRVSVSLFVMSRPQKKAEHRPDSTAIRSPDPPADPP
jgi:hypothetical protein